MARIKRKRGGGYKRSGKRPATKSLRRRKAKKMGKKWKSNGVPRTIVSADFQKRSTAVNFEYTQQWAVSPGILSVANSLQFITWVMNDPSNIFGASLPFGANLSNAIGSLPNYAAPQQPYGQTGGLVDKQIVGHFSNWSKRYEKACVIGSKVTCVLRPKMVVRKRETAEYDITNNQVGQENTASEQLQSALPIDASRIVTLLTDAKPFTADPESLSTLSNVPDIIKRSGVRQKRMSYTPAGKDGAMASLNYSAKKFHNVKDLKDNQQLWTDIDPATGNFTMTHNGQTTKSVYGIVAIQKEELTSPAGTQALAFKAQHDYYIETKYSCTVLFKDPYEIEGTNVPMATTGTGHAGMSMGDEL